MSDETPEEFAERYRGKPPYTFDSTLSAQSEELVDRVLAREDWGLSSTHHCNFCGEEFRLENQRHLQEVYGPGDWQLICTPCLDGTEVEAGK